MCKRVKHQYIALVEHKTVWTVEVKYKHFYVMAKVDLMLKSKPLRDRKTYINTGFCLPFKRAWKC